MYTEKHKKNEKEPNRQHICLKYSMSTSLYKIYLLKTKYSVFYIRKPSLSQGLAKKKTHTKRDFFTVVVNLIFFVLPLL